MNTTEEPTVRIQMFQYAEPSRQWSSFKFATIDKSLKHGTILKIGRKLTPTEDSNVEFITFKSKVVSRNHAELMIANDGTVSFRDTGSSSGSFLNRLRLSPNGRMSSWQQIRSGDIITLGVDYQGRPEEVYKAVQFKIFVTVKSQFQLLASKKSPLKLKKALLSLLAAMNNLNDAKQEYASCTECCICLCSLSPYQALFLAPCSHCFHYKCVIPLLVSESMFQCPLCRQVANLDNTAFIDGEEDVISIDEEDVDMADDSDDKKSMEIVPVNDPMQITTNLSNAVDPMQITTNLPNAIQDVASPNTPIVATSVESHMQEHSKDIFKKRLLALAVEFPDYVKFDEVEKLISESAE